MPDNEKPKTPFSVEVDKHIEAAKGSRNVARDRCFLLLMFRHHAGPGFV
jgi:hypothetical protein